MKTADAKIRKGEVFSIKLPEGTVTIGPGTVPTSEASVKKTIVSEMISESRKASKAGIFDLAEDDYGNTPTATR